MDSWYKLFPFQDLATVLGILTEDDINQVLAVEDRNIVGMIARDNLLLSATLRHALGM